jgi:NitT/TauT family transport system permease protein
LILQSLLRRNSPLNGSGSVGQGMEEAALAQPPIAGALASAPAAEPVRRPRVWLGALTPLNPRRRLMLTIASFTLPLLIWSAFSYVPFLWHPLVTISDPGVVTYLQKGMRLDRTIFDSEVASAKKNGLAPPQGKAANPVYLPAPDEVARALWNGLVNAPTERDAIRLPQSLWHSIQIIFWGFLISSVIGVPLGVLCGAQSTLARITEPFIEFVRYMPAPAFGALMVAILGIYDGPKIAIIIIGTFFQQVLVIANTTRRVDPLLVEAALTMGSRNLRLVRRVIVPAVLPQLYRDQRILLGWAWTYLIVAELIGTSSGITFFITQQARYQHFENVYAAILIIGLVGSATDIVLALIGRRLFPYAKVEA